MKAIYLGWAISGNGPGAHFEWDDETPDRIEILGNTQKLTLIDPRDGKPAKVTILCRFKSRSSFFPEKPDGTHLAVEIEYQDPQFSEGYSSRILLNCTVEETRHIPPGGHDTRRVVLSYSATMPAQSAKSSYILRGWKSEWFRTKVYGRLPEFNYPDLDTMEGTDYELWSQLAFRASPDFTKEVHISDSLNSISLSPTDCGAVVNGIHLSWFGLERLVTTLSRHLIFRGQPGGFHYQKTIGPREDILVTVPDFASIFRHDLGFLEPCNTPRGNGVALQAYNTYMVARHEDSDWADTLRITADVHDDAEIHVQWRFDETETLQYQFENRTDRPVAIFVGMF